MMKSKLYKLTLCLALAAVIALGSVVCAFAAGAERYVNSSTGYKLLIIDELDLLTDAEESKLTEDMQPLTEFGSIAFWTTDEYYANEVEQARLKRKDLFGFDSAGIFVINMNTRKLTIQSYGAINDYVNDSLARSITNNVSHYATSKEYYICAKNAFSQMLDVCSQKRISEPLKVSGYVVISIMLGLIIALGIAFSKRQNPLAKGSSAKSAGEYKLTGAFTAAPSLVYAGCTTTHRPPVTHVSSSSGSSCSSCSSGSSCSSCSSGSSCSSCGGGGCGSGGSSSF